MFRSILLILTISGVCAGQPPTSYDRLTLRGVPKFDSAAERRRLIEIDNRTIALMEDFIQSNEYAIRNFGFSPEQAASMKESQEKVRKLLAEAKQRRQKLLDEEAQEAKARPAPTPVAPMPREKRYD